MLNTIENQTSAPTRNTRMNEQHSSPDIFATAAMPDVPFGLARPDQVATLSGLEILSRIPTGELPAPTMARTLQQWPVSASAGHVEFRGDPSAEYLNPMGLVHGGWTMALLDSALGCAVQTLLEPGETYVSLGTEVKFLRPVLADIGQVRALANVVSRGRRTATADARVEDRKGRILATGTTTCFLDRMSRPD